ncbi:MAG: hypothetical protein AAGE94_11755 [Acidobacteriota bacterium]
MSVDQDLSGDMVKVVQYTVVSVATNIKDTERVLLETPKTVAFGDDMTAADFTPWILSKHADEIRKSIEGLVRQKHLSKTEEDVLLNARWHRVAFQVISRFAPVDIDWSRDQAAELAQLASSLKPPEPVRIAGQDAEPDWTEQDGLDSSPARVSGPQSRNET